MSGCLRSMCRPPLGLAFSSICCDGRVRLGFRVVSATGTSNSRCSTLFTSFSDPLGFRAGQRRTLARASNWTSERSPYETLELERDANEEKIKIAYRRLAKYYHPDVYDGRGTLEEGETAEVRFIKIQAAYELLIDQEKKGEYDKEHHVNPMKASQAWMDWLIKKRKAFDQRGDMAISAWAEQQQREMVLRARLRSRSKIDPEEERRLLAKEKAASKEIVSNTIRRHTLVLKKRDLMRKKAEADKKTVIAQLLAAEGLELDTDDDQDDK